MGQTQTPGMSERKSSDNVCAIPFLYFAREGHLGLEGVIGKGDMPAATELSASRAMTRGQGDSPSCLKTKQISSLLCLLSPLMKLFFSFHLLLA